MKKRALITGMVGSHLADFYWQIVTISAAAKVILRKPYQPNSQGYDSQWHRYCLIVDSLKNKYRQERGPLCNREGGAVSSPGVFRNPQM